jgi:hypothetical protein
LKIFYCAEKGKKGAFGRKGAKILQKGEGVSPIVQHVQYMNFFPQKCSKLNAALAQSLKK